MAPVPTSTENITPPRSSHGYTDSWGYNLPQKEDFDNEMNATTNHDYPQKNHFATQNGNSNSYHSGMERVGRKTNSHDHFSSAKPHNSVDGAAGGRYVAESRTSPSLNGGFGGQAYGPHQTEDEYSRNAVPIDQPVEEHSKWIHRDKLARIENEELQAAGIFIPRSRNHSKQRRDRSRSAMRRGTDASENSHAPRSRKNSTVIEPRNSEPAGETWDLRTPEEIAEEENHAYFTSNNHKGGSRIPVAKVSPAPITVDRFERASIRKTSESPDGERTLTNEKTRPGSAHLKGSDSISINSNLGTSLPAPKRSATATDTSPKKTATGVRKTSGPSKTGTTGTGRPKTRSGSIGGSIPTRPTTRSGELSPANKAPEGDPPWMINSYKPDPRLPPDQQLLPTVARRLQQEKWEKEGKFGDVYDKEFRPLNDNALTKPDQLERREGETEEKDKEATPTDGEWPLKLEPTKSPTQRAGGYSTMPKISDKPHSPLPSPRTPISPTTHQAPPQEQPKAEPSTEPPVQQPQRQPPPEDDSKGGCGCCVVM
ncbi:hypothetical protein F66182_9381 [Fusarium sp. NRRL 66182]|nr:hypothetical protein F66182_9381 [Fusarium sp. NRRL 66182]